MYLKKLTYEGVDYLYEVVVDEYTSTNVYSGVPIEYWEKKYWFFGPMVLKKENKLLFCLNFNIESLELTKQDVQSRFNYALNLMARRQEIENGEII